MATHISLFPTLNDDFLNKIRFQPSEYEWYYVRDDQEFLLHADSLDGGMLLYKIVDEDGVWAPDDYNLCVRRRYSFRTYQSLFGEKGIACKNAILGVAVMWTSADSKQRGVIQIGEIKNSMEDMEFKLDYEFSKAQLRGEVEFTTIIYIKSAGTPSWGEEHLANEYGCILGELDKVIIKLDGTGSVFPVYEVKEPGQPLWYVKCEWDDPTYEQFAECVSININTAHKNYKYLDKTKKSFNEAMLQEIMANALCIIISKLKEEHNYWNTTINGEDVQSGSVSEAIYYFISTLEWDVTTPEKMSLSIRKFFDQRM